MKTNETKDKVTVALEGRIDSSIAESVERELMDAIGNDAAKAIELDAMKLEYISSAGLRVLMKLRRKTQKPLSMINVSPEVYDILDVTGFTQLLEVRKRLREVSVERCEELGSGANGKVYRLTEDRIIKVYRPGFTLAETEAERDISRRAFLMGIPCAIAFDTVKVGDSYGTIYEKLRAFTLVELIRQDPDCLPELAENAARVLKSMHVLEVPEGQLPPASRLIHDTIRKLAAEFDPEEVQKMHALFDALPDQDRFVHNDYHVKNIMRTGDGSFMVIDLGDAGVGSPLIDLIRCYYVYLLMGRVFRDRGDDEMSFIGLTYGECKRFWKIFLDTYCGDEHIAEELGAELEPFVWLDYLLVSMPHPRLPLKWYVNMIREKVLSRYDEMMNMFADFHHLL